MPSSYKRPDFSDSRWAKQHDDFLVNIRYERKLRLYEELGKDTSML
jgi:hypothetical protein